MRKRTLTHPDALAEAGFVTPSQARELRRVTERYALALPPALAALIDPKDPADPIARCAVAEPRSAPLSLQRCSAQHRSALFGALQRHGTG